MFSGAQTLADFGNFFGNIGAITETGGTFGLFDAIGGFAAANPLTAAGLVLGGNALLGGLFGGGNGEPPPGYRRPNWIDLRRNEAGQFYASSSEVPDPQQMARLAGMFGAALNDPTKFNQGELAKLVGTTYTGRAGATSQELVSGLMQALAPAAEAAQRAALISGEAQARQAAAEAAFAEQQRAVAQNRRQMEIDLMEATGNAAGALAARREQERAAMDASLHALYDQITGAQDAAQANETLARSQEQLAAATGARESRERGLGDAARALPGRLGITSLQATRDALSVSEYVAPLERYDAARGALTAAYGRAAGGDLEAVRGFPGLLQSALGIGRDVFASGPQFAELFVEGNRMLQDLISRQQELQAEILRDVPSTILQTSADEVGEIRRQTADLVRGLAEVRDEVARLHQAMAA
jgi:hypothetical protein